MAGFEKEETQAEMKVLGRELFREGLNLSTQFMASWPSRASATTSNVELEEMRARNPSLRIV